MAPSPVYFFSLPAEHREKRKKIKEKYGGSQDHHFLPAMDKYWLIPGRRRKWAKLRKHFTMLGLSIKLSPTQSSTASSHFATASACAQSTNYMGLNAFPKRTMSLSASPCPHLSSLCRKGILTVSVFGFILFQLP